MNIAPNFTTKDWKDLKLSISSSEDVWTKAIEVLKDRIYERYIEPVDLLIKHEEKKDLFKRKFGFTIVAIDCLLIETLQSFKNGTKETKRGKGQDVFVDFLTKSKYLGQYFTEENAKKFYQKYRNGILHQAQTKKDALIWSEWEVVNEIDGVMIINRTKLHNLIKKDFDYYLKELAIKDNKTLRKNFIKKMNFITEMS